jgi:hypothetical protein
MFPCIRRDDAAARRAPDETLLDEVGPDDVLYGVARLGQARRDNSAQPLLKNSVLAFEHGHDDEAPPGILEFDDIMA